MQINSIVLSFVIIILITTWNSTHSPKSRYACSLAHTCTHTHTQTHTRVPHRSPPIYMIAIDIRMICRIMHADAGPRRTVVLTWC